jgi:SNF2 family DNA or RNA helicase
VAASAAVVTQKLQQMSSGFVYTPEPVWFSSHKFDALEDLLNENQQTNTIVVYNYKEELDELKRRFRHLVTLDDATAIERWNAGSVRLLGLHPRSAGHGLNLQHGGCHMVFLSLPWSLELYEQTVGRLHRGGQQKDVWVYILMTKDTVDQKVWDALHDKRSLADIALESLK